MMLIKKHVHSFFNRSQWNQLESVAYETIAFYISSKLNITFRTYLILLAEILFQINTGCLNIFVLHCIPEVVIQELGSVIFDGHYYNFCWPKHHSQTLLSDGRRQDQDVCDRYNTILYFHLPSLFRNKAFIESNKYLFTFHIWLVCDHDQLRDDGGL